MDEACQVTFPPHTRVQPRPFNKTKKQMKKVIQSIVLTLLLSVCGLQAQVQLQLSTISLTAGNVYYFRLANSVDLDALQLWQSSGFVSGLNPSSGDNLFFPRSDGGLITVFHYNDGTYTGWVNNAFVVISNTPSAFMIIFKRSGEMTWSLPPGTHFYGSDLVASTNWENDFKASLSPAIRKTARRSFKKFDEELR